MLQRQPQAVLSMLFQQAAKHAQAVRGLFPEHATVLRAVLEPPLHKGLATRQDDGFLPACALQNPTRCLQGLGLGLEGLQPLLLLLH